MLKYKILILNHNEFKRKWNDFNVPVESTLIHMFYSDRNASKIGESSCHQCMSQFFFFIARTLIRHVKFWDYYCISHMHIVSSNHFYTISVMCTTIPKGALLLEWDEYVPFFVYFIFCVSAFSTNKNKVLCIH